jgi:tetratricopeptide (TPR) repeat protein
MKKTLSIALFSTLVISASAFCAEGTVSSSSIKGSATRLASPAEQIAQASRLWQQMERTPAPQKLDLFAQTWANLALVRKAWPNDRNACVRSGIMQADLAAELGVLPKAVNALLEVLPAAAHTNMEAQVERRLGRAYEQSGNPAEGEKHFLAAERALHATHTNRVDSQAVLSSVALFYSHQNKPQEAIQRFREAENLPRQDLVNQLHFQLSILDEAARLGRDAAAPELAHFDDLVSAARRTTLSPVDATLVNHMTQHAQRVRDKVRL